MKIIYALAALAMLAAAPAVSAQNSFNPSTGTGSASKAAVSQALGLNNTQFQSQAPSMAFTYDVINRYGVTCDDAGTIATAQMDYGVSTTVNRTVNYGGGGNVSGFTFTGFGAIASYINSYPIVVGESCPYPRPGTVTEVTMISQVSAGLKVNHVALPI